MLNVLLCQWYELFGITFSFLGSFSYSCILCPIPMQDSYIINPKQHKPKSERPKLPPAHADFLCGGISWWGGLKPYYTHKGKSRPCLLSCNLVIQPSWVGWESEQKRLMSVHRVVSDVPGKEVKGCDPIPRSASPVSWNMALKAPRCFHFGREKIMSKFECVWWYCKTQKATT